MTISWWDKLLGRVPKQSVSRDILFEMVRKATVHGVLQSDAQAMIEAVLQFGDLSVADAMVPKSLVDFICLNDPVEKFLPFVIDMAHSRFPVFGDDKDDVRGILLAKDLLRYFHQPESFDVYDMLRPVVFVPESKPLAQLLRDFRAVRNHMAIVVDEYGHVSGIITIEDVIEQIIGDIEDEYDFDETEGNIVPSKGGRYRVKATTLWDDLNKQFEWNLVSPQDIDTVGGWVMQYLGYLPKKGERIDCGNGWRFLVLRADSRRIHTLLLERIKD
jgi:magnesium and cobalt transporter